MNSDSVTPQNPQVLGTCPGYIMTEDSSSGWMFKRVLFRIQVRFPNKTKFLESQLGLHLPLAVGVWYTVQGFAVFLQCPVITVPTVPTVWTNQIAGILFAEWLTLLVLCSPRPWVTEQEVPSRACILWAVLFEETLNADCALFGISCYHKQ